GRHFIATEYVEGQTLRKRLQTTPMEIVEVLDVAIQIAGALEEAHAASIIHRDIKPENVMIRRNGHVKVLDFGLAKLIERQEPELTDTEAVTRALVQTDAGLVLGTSQYMSPEQARGKPVDARTDIWSLGVVLYEMATGRAPFVGETKTDVIVAIAKNDPPALARFAPNAPAEFEWIALKALRKDVDERYQTIKEFESDLKKLKQRIEFQSELERSMGPEQYTAAFSGLADTEMNRSMPRLSTQAMAVQLGQSPFLNIFSEDRVHDALKYMNVSPDARITRDIGKDICARNGIKAMLLGSISRVGTQYIVLLDAVNSQTGDSIANEQVAVDSKEAVLKSLGPAASQLREKLGETLGSIQKFDAPIEQ